MRSDMRMHTMRAFSFFKFVHQLAYTSMVGQWVARSSIRANDVVWESGFSPAR